MGAEKRVGEAPFREGPSAAAKLQGGTRGDRQKIDAGLSAAAGVQLNEREHRESVDVFERLDALGDELA